VILQPVTPVVVKVVDAPSRETSVADILVGAAGFVGFVLLAAAVVGLVAGYLFFQFKRVREAAGGAVDDSASLNLSALPNPPQSTTSKK
jgi:hypothetical protein